MDQQSHLTTISRNLPQETTMVMPPTLNRINKVLRISNQCQNCPRCFHYATTRSEFYARSNKAEDSTTIITRFHKRPQSIDGYNSTLAILEETIIARRPPKDASKMPKIGIPNHPIIRRQLNLPSRSTLDFQGTEKLDVRERRQNKQDNFSRHNQEARGNHKHTSGIEGHYNDQENPWRLGVSPRFQGFRMNARIPSCHALDFQTIF